MTAVNILKFSSFGPDDTSSLERLRKETEYDASDILAVIGKTEGNGCVNDFSRTLSSAVWKPLIPPTSVSIFSGGTEGVLSPHLTLLLSSPHPTGLIAAIGSTPLIQPHLIGRLDHVHHVANTLASMLTKSGIENEAVKLVLVKCPLLTTSKVEKVRRMGLKTVVEDTYQSMGRSRHASALGIYLALDEGKSSSQNGDNSWLKDEESLEETWKSGKVWSTKASCSSGAELENCQILVLASSAKERNSAVANGGYLDAITGVMEDAIDSATLLRMLRQVGEKKGKVVQIFVKAEADPTGEIRGMRHTMETDSDLQGTRHARAAVGGLVAGLVGDTRIYVSGGAEGQGPRGGGNVCVVYKVDGEK